LESRRRAGEHDHVDEEDDSSYVFYGAGGGPRTGGAVRVVAGPADFAKWAQEGIITQAVANGPSWNPRRPDGLYGIDCPGCALGPNGEPLFSEEVTWHGYKKQYGAPPFGPGCQRPPSHVVIPHHREMCFKLWLRARKQVEEGKAASTALEPLTKARFEGILAASKAANQA
jgi:hypothetical protein